MLGAHRHAGRGEGGAIDAAAFQRRVSEAKELRNLSDILSRHTTLRKHGRREMIGLCPIHKERTPSFQLNDDNGQFYCFGCGWRGDAITALMRLDGLTFMQALAALEGDNFPTISEAERAQRKVRDAADLAERIAVARSIWDSGEPAAGTLAEVYLRSRSITMRPPDTVRFARTPRWRDERTGEVGRDYPALVCRVDDVAGNLVAVQCVFLRPDGRGKYERTRQDGSQAKPKLSFGSLVGSAFKLGPSEAKEIVALEGPEDALTLAQELPGRAIWCACGTGLLPLLDFPPHVRSVVLAGDNNNAGRLAVSKASDAFVARNLCVKAMFPPAEYRDWNDALRGIRQ